MDRPNKRFSSRQIITVAAIVGLLCSIGTAVAAKKIHGKKLVNSSVGAKKLKPSLRDKINRAGGTTQGGTQGPQGAPGSPGQSGIATYENPEWGVIDRNTIGSAVAELRGGPFVPEPPATNGAPPFGDGSLGLQTSNAATTAGDPAEKISFGNQVDFLGDPVLDIEEVGFHAFQTGENNAISTSNVPNITFEIDPNLTANPTNFSSMVWNPGPLASNDWSGYLDATSTGNWFLTGQAGTATGCTLATPCTFDALMTALDDGGASGAPTILTFAVAKGRDFTYSGAVDGLRLNDVIYDFEPFGVVERAP